MQLFEEENRLVLQRGVEKLYIESWGKNSLRVRMTREAEMDKNDWALCVKHETPKADIKFTEVDTTEPWWYGKEKEAHKSSAKEASITNGDITAKINFEGWISFYNKDGNLLTKEYWRTRDRIDRYAVPLRVEGRELKPIISTNDFTLTARFESFDDEHIYGMGQYQDSCFDRKGSSMELAHRNSQASVPFFVSSRGYGFLWNNPSIGSAVFASNKTEWSAKSTKKLDYWITAAETPAKIEEQYTSVAGRTPMMPEYGMGFWQCKLRYRTQDEVLKVAREYHKRKIPVNVIVIDFFHWTRQGEFKFEPRNFPDPEAMIKELDSMGIKLCVSVWPTVDEKATTFGEMADKGYLVNCDRGNGLHMTWLGNTYFFDATNPGARKFVWNQCKKNYYDKGVKIFWLDEAEPEYGPYDWDIYRYYAGPVEQCANIYPEMYAKGFAEGLKEAGEKDAMSLVRCAWAGSQKYGVLTWTGDVHSDFRAFNEQLQAGLNMSMAGIPWWTTDIGGFVGGDGKSEEFRELLVRWFAWGVFCPVFRLHGERVPYFDLEKGKEVIDGVPQFSSAQANEIWSFGDDNYEIMKNFILIRERIRPYIRECMEEAHKNGSPVARPMYYDFYNDKKCAVMNDQYMFGPNLLVAPVMQKGMKERNVYLPEGHKWKEAKTGTVYDGGQTVKVQTPLDVIPVFIKDSRNIPVYN
ncbi:MAG: TIM-barrel domain-containing protein [Treponema sp.]